MLVVVPSVFVSLAAVSPLDPAPDVIEEEDESKSSSRNCTLRNSLRVQTLTTRLEQSAVKNASKPCPLSE